jgi:hypothetical protein
MRVKICRREAASTTLFSLEWEILARIHAHFMKLLVFIPASCRKIIARILRAERF